MKFKVDYALNDTLSIHTVIVVSRTGKNVKMDSERDVWWHEEITKVEDDVDEHIARRIEGTLTVPLYLEHSEPGAHIHRDADGAPAANGTICPRNSGMTALSTGTSRRCANVECLCSCGRR